MSSLEHRKPTSEDFKNVEELSGEAANDNQEKGDIELSGEAANDNQEQLTAVEVANDNQEAVLGVPGAEKEGTNARIVRVEESLDEISGVVAKEQRQIDEIRNKLGISDGEAVNDNTELTAMEDNLERRRKDLEKMKEGRSKTEPLSMGDGLQKRYDSLEKKSREMREGIIRDLINESIQKMYDEWDSILSESVNQQTAMDLIAQRTAGSIMLKGEDFIKTGKGVDSLCGNAKLETVEYDGDMYISEFIINFNDGDSNPHLSKKDINEGNEKINDKIREQIKAAQKPEDKK